VGGNCQWVGYLGISHLKAGAELTAPALLTVQGEGEGALLHMTNCQLSISCGRICSVLKWGFLHCKVWFHVIQAAAKHDEEISLAAQI
jgi:hypothetical protein